MFQLLKIDFPFFLDAECQFLAIHIFQVGFSQWHDRGTPMDEEKVAQLLLQAFSPDICPGYCAENSWIGLLLKHHE
jgi:hypothetical protein